jgi:hypothetical protein
VDSIKLTLDIVQWRTPVIMIMGLLVRAVFPLMDYLIRNVFFLILVCEEATGPAATPGLLCQPRVIVKMIVEK